MQNRFEFLEDQFPKLADYARKAQESFDADKNICLLNLGRIAENISKSLFQRLSIPDNNPEDLLKLGIIDENIYRKINALLEAKTDAVNSEYNSEMACSRLMLTAEELCRWFIFEAGESKFNFLADLFPENSPVPPLASLAAFGREAEENLYSNTRYALICLGDIGEAIVNFLLNVKGIEINFHDNDQSDKINILHRKGIITKEINDTLHNIRKVRNEAVHSRFSSQEEARKLLDQTLPLCEWLFRMVIAPGDFIKGKIANINQDGIDVITGRLRGIVSKEEIPPEKEYSEGERKIFKVIDAEDEKINLSLSQVYTDPWINAARRYEKYKIGQILNVRITRVEKDIGAAAEICGTYERTEARIPESEYGNAKIRLWNEIKACVKWFDPANYPYMILSAENVQQERNFIRFCAGASPEELQEILPEVADVNQKNKNGINSLMMAALHNPNPEIIHILVNSGAKVNSVNYAGNTPLILAAMYNNSEIVRALIEHEADIEALNGKNKLAYDYALNNSKLEGSDVIDMLKVKRAMTDEEFLELCKSCSSQEINEAISEGANINAQDNDGNTALILASMINDAETVSAILERSPQINIANNKGYTALMASAQYNNSEIISVLLNAGAEINCVDQAGNTALMIACAYNTDDAVNLLLNAGADTEIRNKAGCNALIIAARSKHPETIQELLRRTQDVNVQNNEGDTALIIASEFNNSEVARSILEAQAEVNLQNNKGMTALMAAVYNLVDSEKVLSVLLEAKPDLSLRDKQGLNVVDIAKNEPALKGSKALILKLQSRLLKLCKTGSPEEISEYINLGINVNIRSAKNSVTALMLAIQNNTSEVAEVLLEAGAEINAQDARGYTALILAAARKNDEFVSLMLKYNADVNITDAKGYKALNYALGNEKLKETEALTKLKELTHN